MEVDMGVREGGRGRICGRGGELRLNLDAMK